MAFEHKNPKLPFKADVFGGLVPGSEFIILGKIPNGSRTFGVNLCGQHHIPLHISVCLDSGCVIRNHSVAGEWGPEERIPQGIDHIVKGRPFIMSILTEQTHYQISINGTLAFDFVHRLPFEEVRLLYINGDVGLECVSYVLNESRDPPPTYSESPDQQQVSSLTESLSLSSKKYKVRPIWEPAIPFLYPILTGLRVGYAARVIGRPNKNAKSFRLDFLCGRGPFPDPDIALHISIRLNEKQIVLNSFLENGWGPEQRSGIFPFYCEEKFDLLVQVHQEYFELSVDGRRLAAFNHRVRPLFKIDYFKMSGDFSVLQFELQRTPIFIPNVVLKRL